MRARTVLACCVTASLATGSFAAPRLVAAQASALRIIVLEGEDAVNLIDKKTAVKPTVEVRDRNDLPVAGALVRFAIRSRAAAFNNGVRELSLTTDSLGRATVSELTPLGKGTIDTLMQAGWVRPKGRRAGPGRPLLWATTPEFLAHFFRFHFQRGQHQLASPLGD